MSAIDQLFAPLPLLAELPPGGAAVLTGLRSWVVAHRTGRCPRGALRHRLGCVRAAAHAELLIAEIAAAWPEPFAVSPPCCPRVSHDESLLAAMLARAAAADRPGFDQLSCDLLGSDARERLFLSLRVLHDVLQG